MFAACGHNIDPATGVCEHKSVDSCRRHLPDNPELLDKRCNIFYQDPMRKFKRPCEKPKGHEGEHDGA